MINLQHALSGPLRHVLQGLKFHVYAAWRIAFGATLLRAQIS